MLGHQGVTVADPQSIVDDYAKALDALSDRAELTTTSALRRSLQGVLRDLRRAYGRYLGAAEPTGNDPLGRPIQRSGAAVIRESSSRFQSIVRAAEQFLSVGELDRWEGQFRSDLEEAQALGRELAGDLRRLSNPNSGASGGANMPAIDAAVRTASAYIEGESIRFRGQIAQITADAAARGFGASRMELQVRRALEGARDPQGLTQQMGLKQRAALIARSEMANAYVGGQLDNLRRNGFDYVRWIASRDERTCRFCVARHGQIYPASRIVIPAHPRCRCSLQGIDARDVEGVSAEDRREYLDEARWEQRREEAWREFAKSQGLEQDKADAILRKSLRTPTASEKRRSPDLSQSLLPSVLLGGKS
jgi:SPP1 gp7 family putative phage head morphogenesis protein